MKKLFFFALLCSFPPMVKAQECNCPTGVDNDNDGKPYKVFRLSSNQELGICGYQTVDGNDTTYTQFTLFHCADANPVKEWGKDKTCKIEKARDTLVVMDMYGLPIGQEFSTIVRPFYIHKFFFKKGALQEVAFFRKGLVKYSKQQIEQTITEYKNLPQTSSEQTMHVANMLFCAYISGSKEAEGYLVSIPAKFGPFDGALTEEWNAISATYDLWKNKNNIK